VRGGPTIERFPETEGTLDASGYDPRPVNTLRHRLDRATRAFAPTRRIRFALARESLERFAAGRPISVLDAGCSEGLFSESLAGKHHNWTIEAVDIDADVIALAQASFREARLDNVSARVADVTRQLDGDVYDAVAALECLTLVDDDEAALASFARTLKPGGLLVGHVPEKTWQPLFSKRATWDGERRHGYTESELRELLDRAGLKQVSITPTSRRLALLGREIAASDRMYRGGLLTRLVWFPFAVAFTWLDRRGITWGPAAGYFFEVHSRVSDEGDAEG
jgi:SAM-dependent methyltransferase